MSLPWRRFIAIGDSLTEGVGDPTPLGLRGWADRLVEGMRAIEPDLIYANLAYRGLTTREVIDTQLERALALRPDLSCALVGMNDLIKADFDPASYEKDLDELVGALRAANATVLTGTYGEVTRYWRAPARVKEIVRVRLEDANEVIRTVSARHDALMVEARGLADSTDVRSYSIDRLHPGPRGHLLIAHSFARVLSADGGVAIPLADPDEGPLGAGKLAQARWIVRQTTPAQIARFITRTAFPVRAETEQ